MRRASRDISDSISKASKDAKRELGFDSREYWDFYQNQVDALYGRGTRANTDANVAYDIVETLEDKARRVPLTEEEKKMLYNARDRMKFWKSQKNRAKEKADEALKQYESTPIGTLEKTFNSVVKTGESVVNSITSGINSAASDLANLFKKIF